MGLLTTIWERLEETPDELELRARHLDTSTPILSQPLSVSLSVGSSLDMTCLTHHPVTSSRCCLY